MKTFLTLTLALLCFVVSAQTDILDARTNYDLDDEVTVTGIVTSSDEFGPVRYIQDETAGIAIYPGFDWGTFDQPEPGDNITVTGVLTEFNGLLEVGPDLSVVTINSSGNDIPDPQVITPDEMGEDDEGELIMMEGCLFENGGDTFQGNTTYGFSSGGQSSAVYIRTSNPLVGEEIPFCSVNITGIASQFSFTGDDGYQLLPRGAADFAATSTICFISPVEQSNITTTSFTVTWETDNPGDTKIEYGTTPSLGMEIEIDEDVTSHSIDLEDLEPATVYYVKASSSDDMTTAESLVVAFITKSNSSGDITVYFTNSVDTSVAEDEEAIGLFTATNDTIAAYINRAESTIDIAAYNINDQTIVAAINEAYNEGIQIRYIAHGGNANTGIESFEDGIPVLYREDDLGSGMHNKFLIIDADDPDKSFLITGSTNLTTANLVDDFNNVIIFQEQSLCRGFEVEFEEMWGTDGAEPDEDNAKFGGDKSFNTPVEYYAGDVLVEAYFSPTDNTNQAILETIQSTDSELDFVLLTFTRDDLAEAAIEVNDSFFSFARGIIEQTSNTGSEFETLDDAGVDVYSHEGIDGQVHHKYCIVDHGETDQDPVVLTGSHNWSSSAESFNDENTVIVHDQRVANLYYQEFMARWNEFSTNVEDLDLVQDAYVYPNPANNQIAISSSASNLLSVTIFDSKGKMVAAHENVVPGSNMDVSNLAQGFYSVQLNMDNGSQKVVPLVVR